MKLNFEYASGAGEHVAQVGDGLLYRVLAVPDSDAESPRDFDCNACVMVMNHGRYRLGDGEHGESQARDAVRSSRFYRDTWEDSESGQFTFKGETRDCFDFSNNPDVWAAMLLCDDIVTQPIYLYEHSGITISTGRFSCPWDSGQVGFAFVAKQQLRDAQSATRWTPALRKWARDAIELEVQIYDSYLRGDVYGYVLEVAECYEDCEPDLWEHVSSCFGYYGDFEESGLAQDVMKSLVHDMVTRGDFLASDRSRNLESLKGMIADLRRMPGANLATLRALKSQIAHHASEVRRCNMQLRSLAALKESMQ